ncbi:MAG: hypothetical protein II797_04130, partial [Clostridia bacterium]|nr:hypothetical protein [Clostridia bacterium]
MRNKSFPVLLVSSLLKAAVIVSALLGTYLSYLSGKDSFMGGMNVFMFFTIQSNLALALLCAVGYLDLFRKNPMQRWWKVVRLAGTV